MVLYRRVAMTAFCHLNEDQVGTLMTAIIEQRYH